MTATLHRPFGPGKPVLVRIRLWAIPGAPGRPHPGLDSRHIQPGGIPVLNAPEIRIASSHGSDAPVEPADDRIGSPAL